MIESFKNNIDEYTLDLELFNFKKSYFTIIDFKEIDYSLLVLLLTKFCENLKKSSNGMFGRFKAKPHDHLLMNIYDYTHKVNSFCIKNNSLMCNITILDTVAGKDLKELIQNGYEVAPYFDTYDKRVDLTDKGVLYVPHSINIKELYTSFFGDTNFPDEMTKYINSLNKVSDNINSPGFLYGLTSNSPIINNIDQIKLYNFYQ